MKTILTSILVILALSLQAQIFSPKLEISSTSNNPEVLISMDINQDGYPDLVSSSINDSKIVSYLFDETSRSFGSEQTISTEFGYVMALFPADLNNDAYPDFLGVSQLDNKVFWFKNNGDNSFSLQPLINGNADQASAVTASDLDNDGDMDVVSASKGNSKVQWYENDGYGNFSVAHLITDEAELPVAITTADIDNDGFNDVMAGYAQGNKIVYFRNTGSGSFDAQIVIGTQCNNISSIAAADINGDGLIDMVSTSKSDNKLAWYKNFGGNGNFSDQIIISDQLPIAYKVVVADFDLDNDMDVVCSSMGDDKIVLFENTDGAGDFVPHQAISTRVDGPKGMAVADFDNDGDMDIAAAISVEDNIVWFENGKAAYLVHLISDSDFVNSIQNGDVNNDGNIDIVYASSANIYLILNNDAGESFMEVTIYNQAHNIQSIQLADIDSDGDLDLAVADWLGNEFYWFRNQGNGDFGDPIFIDIQSDSPCYLNVADVDHDGDVDLMVALYYEYSVAIYENDGAENFTKVVVANGFNFQNVIFSDVNHDTYSDIIIAADDKLYYALNDGTGSFLSTQMINSSSEAMGLITVDLNNDGWDDLVFTRGSTHWLLNNHDETYDAYSIDPWGDEVPVTYGDIDNDGDMDILMGGRNARQAFVCENTDEGENMLVQPNINIDGNPEEVTAGDLNNDGFIDIIVGSWPAETVHWAENYQFRVTHMPFDQFVCQGQKAYFSVLSAGVVAYQWQVDAGSGFADVSNNSSYAGAHKAQLSINSVDESDFGNQYRCQVYDKTGAMLTTDAATLNPYEASIACVENQSRMAENNGTYTVLAHEFDVDTIFNKCSENLTLVNDYNNSGTLAGEVLSVGDYSITWTLSDAGGELVDECVFDVEILNYVGISNPEMKNITIIPNPNNGVFTVDLSHYKSKDMKELSITNMRGKIIGQLQVNEPMLTIDISTWPAGIYFLKLRTSNGMIVKRIVKE